MSLDEAREGAQFITLDTYRGNFELTILASGWRAETVPLISGNGFHLRSVIRLRADDSSGAVIDLPEKGIHPPVEAPGLWSRSRLSFLADRDTILTVYPWLIREGFLRAASEIEDTFFDFFVDNTMFWDQLLRQSSA